MSRGTKLILCVLATPVLLVFLCEASCESIGDGWPSISVTVHGTKPFAIRRAAYINIGQRAVFESCLKEPQFADSDFRNATIQDPNHFEFSVPCTERTSPFRILKDRFVWMRFAVFRIETLTGEVHCVGTEIPDVRTTKTVTIDIP